MGTGRSANFASCKLLENIIACFVADKPVPVFQQALGVSGASSRRNSGDCDSAAPPNMRRHTVAEPNILRANSTAALRDTNIRRSRRNPDRGKRAERMQPRAAAEEVHNNHAGLQNQFRRTRAGRRTSTRQPTKRGGAVCLSFSFSFPAGISSITSTGEFLFPLEASSAPILSG